MKYAYKIFECAYKVLIWARAPMC